MNSITVAPFLFSLRRFFLVGQTPWSARDAPVPLFLGTEGLPDPNGPTRGPAGRGRDAAYPAPPHGSVLALVRSRGKIS
jgi:hypothetical protein